MTLFWSIAAALILLALVFLTLPLLRRAPARTVDADQLNLAVIKQQLQELETDLANGNLDASQYDAARHDLEKELLRDVAAETGSKGGGSTRSGRWAVGLLAIGIPTLALALYQNLGNQEIIPKLAAAGPPAAPASTADAKAHAAGMPPMDVLVERLAERLEQDPDNVEGWMMLGRSYMSLGRTQDALDAYQMANQKAPQDPQVLMTYAQALASQNNNRLSGRPAELIAKAREVAPEDPNVLWLSGIAAFEQRRFSVALEYWEKVLPMLQPGSDDARQVTGVINQARAELGIPQLPVEAPVAANQPAPSAAPPAMAAAQSSPPQAAPAAQSSPPQAAPAASSSALTVQVTLAPELQSQVSQDDHLFIFARAYNGPRMPLAAVRKQVRDLPLTLTLDDSNAMSPQFALSAFPEVVIGARISRSGNATPQSGDLEGETGPVRPGQAEPVAVVIDARRE